MPKTLATLATLLIGVALAAAPSRAGGGSRAGATAEASGLSEASHLSAIYDTILDARFDEARTALASACPPAPVPACDTLREIAVWWEIQEDEHRRTLDDRLEATAQTAIASASTWTRANPETAEAWFYRAAAYAPLAQWRVLRGQRMAAARDGKRIKDALDRALALDPQLQDAWFGIGLYHYYADVAPLGLKILRFLLLLPGGDRAQGLQEMLQARAGGELLRDEADYQLHWIYLWYENQPQRALDLLRTLDRRHPSNPLFLARIADVQHVYFSDHQASADAWQALIARAAGSRVALPVLAANRARVGLASELVELAQPGRALDVLQPVDARADVPYGIASLAQLTRGDAFAALGSHDRAIAAYQRAAADAPGDDPDDVRARARRGIDRERSAR